MNNSTNSKQRKETNIFTVTRSGHNSCDGKEKKNEEPFHQYKTHNKDFVF